MNDHIRRILDRLAAGETFENRESGNSMTPVIQSRQPVTLAPVDADKLERGDVVYVKVRGNFYTHEVYAVRGDEVQIGNHHGHINGWTPKRQVYGIVVAVGDRPLPRALEKVRKVEAS
jgi:hypothetical protein